VAVVSELGMPRSTARAWLSLAPTVVVRLMGRTSARDIAENISKNQEFAMHNFQPLWYYCLTEEGEIHVSSRHGFSGCAPIATDRYTTFRRAQE
jgi:hypothetical protein